MGVEGCRQRLMVGGDNAVWVLKEDSSVIVGTAGGTGRDDTGGDRLTSEEARHRQH